jgi:hypothetical protein
VLLLRWGKEELEELQYNISLVVTHICVSLTISCVTEPDAMLVRAFGGPMVVDMATASL